MHPRLARRQYPSTQSAAPLTGEQAHLMPENAQPAFQPIHGEPVYIEELPRHNRDRDYKNIALDTYPVSAPSHGNSFAEFDAAKGFRPLTPKPKKPSIRQRHRGFFKFLGSLTAFCVLGALLAIPIIVTADARDVGDADDQTRQTRNIIYYTFIMLENVLAMTGVFYIIAMLLPYAFRFVAHYINPAYARYWRALIILRTPIVALFAVIAGYISLYIWFYYNPNISIAKTVTGSTEEEVEEKAEAQADVYDTIYTILRILLYLVLWAGGYLLEKILITYLTIHYHYRAHHPSILRSKKLLDALVTLYKYSISVYPVGHSCFAAEDYVIHKARESKDGHFSIADSAVSAMDKVTGTFLQGFGIVFGSESTSHWFAPRSTYALIGQALQHPASSAALAKRIWMSLVSEGSEALIVQDIKDALGSHRATEAAECFAILDENENGDIRLSELVPSVVEAGKKRREIYLGMANITHVINTLNWIMIGMLAMLMLSLVLISEVDLLSKLKETIGLSALGLSVVVGRTLNDFVQGAIFTILDHPYDVGDAVEIYNLAESKKCVLIVKRISLLYTIFEEAGCAKEVQYANMRSKIKRITNLTRSDKNREAITFGVDFATSFKDIQLLRQELQTFIAAPENSRDYYPDLILRVTNLCDLARLELKVSVRHKSNWSNDGLRSARSSRLHCAIVAAVRRVPIQRPVFIRNVLGDETRPTYSVINTDTEAAEKRAAENDKQEKKRLDYALTRVVKDDVDFTALTEAEIAAQAKREADAAAEARAAKEAKDKQDEIDATISLMGIKKDGTGARNGASTGVDLYDDNGHSTFQFITGEEKGMRMTRRSNMF